MAKHLVISGERLHKQKARLMKDFSSTGAISVWVKEADVLSLFGEDETWLLSSLHKGSQSFEGLYLLHFESVSNLHAKATLWMSEPHTLYKIERRSLAQLRIGISSLLSRDQSLTNETDMFLKRAIFQIRKYRNISDRQAYEERRASCYLPFQTKTQVSRVEAETASVEVNPIREGFLFLKEGAIKRHELLMARLEEARQRGIDRLLSLLPVRPSSEHNWYPKHHQWLTAQEEAARVVDFSIYQFKGLNDDWI